MACVVDTNQMALPRLTIEFQSDDVAEAKPMFASNQLRDELQELKDDVARLLNTSREGIFDTSMSRADALAGQIKSALNDLSQTLSEQEDHIENIITDRPITSLASAFALGVVIGFMLRTR